MILTPGLQFTVQDSQLAAKWKEFLDAYSKADVQEAALNYPDQRSVMVQFRDIDLRDPELADYLLQRPQHALRVGQTALFQVDVTVEPKPRLSLRVAGLPESARKRLSWLRVEDLGRFLAIDGLVTKVTEVYGHVLEAAYECKACGNLVHVFQDEDRLEEPVQCDNCERKTSWRFKQEMSRSVDFQRLELQEAPEDLPGGDQPGRLEVHLREDLAGRVQAGERVRINGKLSVLIRREGQAKVPYTTYILEAVSVELREDRPDELSITSEDREAFQAIAQRSDHVDVLLVCLAPKIHGERLAKAAILYALFGGVSRYEDEHPVRGDVHVLLLGDPGVAKSKLLKLATKTAVRSAFASGKGATAVGLTAATVRDDFSRGRWTVQAGALVKADLGLAAIDEGDKVAPEHLDGIMNALEDQRVYVTKAGLDVELRSRCTVVMAANPEGGRFNDHDALLDQLTLKPELVSRFDLIVVMRDVVSEELDRAIIQQMRANRGDDDATTELDRQALRKYVAYARTLRPVITDDAAQFIEDRYVQLRLQQRAVGGPVPLTRRHAEALYRLTEARARMRLSEVAELRDARDAEVLMMACLASAGVLQDDGSLNADVIEARPPAQDDRVQRILAIVREQCRDAKETTDTRVFQAAQERHSISVATSRKDVETLLRNNALYRPSGGSSLAPLRN